MKFTKNSIIATLIEPNEISLVVKDNTRKTTIATINNL